MMPAFGDSHNVSRDQHIELFKGTRLCRFNAMGRCKRGRECKFAHGEADVREQPDFSKTRLCLEFIETGFCRRGEGCKFAHGTEELRSRRETKPSGRASYKGCNDMTSLGMQELLQAVMQVRKPSTYEEAALKLLLKGASRFPLGEVPQQAAVAEDCFSKEVLPFSRQSTSFDDDDDDDDDSSLPAFSRSSTEEAFLGQNMPEAASTEEASNSAYDASESSAASSPRHQSSDVEMVMVKNTFIHIETQEEAAPRHLRRVCSAPALLKGQ